MSNLYKTIIVYLMFSPSWMFAGDNFSGVWLSGEMVEKAKLTESLSIDQRGNDICGNWSFYSGHSKRTYGLIIGKVTENNVIIWYGDDLSDSDNDLALLPSKYTFSSNHYLTLENNKLYAKYVDLTNELKTKFVIEYVQEKNSYHAPDEVWRSCHEASEY